MSQEGLQFTFTRLDKKAMSDVFFGKPYSNRCTIICYDAPWSCETILNKNQQRVAAKLEELEKKTDSNLLSAKL